MFKLNEILIKSFTYTDKKIVEKKIKSTKYDFFKLTKYEEEIVQQEEIEIKHTHAIVYLIDQNRFWYYNILGDEIVEKHHTKNNLINSVKIIDDMIERFIELEYDNKIENIYYIKDKFINKYSTISDISQQLDNKKERLSGLFL